MQSSNKGKLIHGVKSQNSGVLWGDIVAWSRHEGDFPAGGASLFLNLGAGDLRVFIL